MNEVIPMEISLLSKELEKPVMKKIILILALLLILVVSISSVAYAGFPTPTETPTPTDPTPTKPPPDKTPTPTPPPPGTNECTPGFWKQPHHFRYWETDFGPNDMYDDDMTYLEALQGGKNTRRSRVIVAGWLNDANPDAPCIDEND